MYFCIRYSLSIVHDVHDVHGASVRVDATK